MHRYDPYLTAEQIVEILAVRYKLEDAWILTPGNGTVHIPTVVGSIYIANCEGEHPHPSWPFGLLIGQVYVCQGGRETNEFVRWRSPNATDMAAVVERAARLVQQTRWCDGAGGARVIRPRHR